MERDKRSVAFPVLSFLFAVTGAATALFWLLFFSGRINATETEQDVAFEKAFPLADTWMIACCLSAAINLPQKNLRGLFSGAAAASALIFLGCMDILYSLENRKYWPIDGERAQMLFVHLWTAGFGSAALITLWKNRGLISMD